MAAKRKGPVFRVTGLSASQPDDVLEKSLTVMMNDLLLEKERDELRIKVAIVPSCYNENRRVALVEFCDRVPAFLQELKDEPLKDWQEVFDDDTDVNFDQHFHGFTQLYAPASDGPVTADIIAISGLDGHAYGSWRGKGNLGRMWLRDFLSKDLPHCRTMTYGYNSKLNSHGIDKIMDYGRGLMEELKKIRTGEAAQRPLFFIVHSFGGIILAHCLVKAVQTNEDDNPTIASLHPATYGMLLFGIPHKGLVIDDIQKIMTAEHAGHPRNMLLEQIRSKSDLLANQLADFVNLIRDRKVVTFYETGQTRQLEYDSQSKSWKRTGDFFTAVETDSALLQLPDSVEEKIPLELDHSMLVKFDTKDSKGYSSAKEKLKKFEKNASQVVAARFLRTSRRRKPCIMIPFSRDDNFVGREHNIKQLTALLERKSQHNHQRAALVGLGGIGKSQIAIEYAYRYRESLPGAWIFWIHASSAQRFIQGYAGIARQLEIPGHDNPKADPLQLVCDWLCDERNGKWLMIIDNADDEEVFTSSTISFSTAETSHSPNSLKSFIPQSSQGSVLATSRNLLAAMILVGSRPNVVEVESMTDKEALALLESKVLDSRSWEEEAKILVKMLDCIPLAVVQASSYIARREPRVTIADYLQLFKESENSQYALLNDQKAGDLRRDDRVSNAVITTWQISMEQIRRTVPEAADLLSLMSMLDHQRIPEFLLYDGKDKLKFDDAITPLLNFSLIKVQNVWHSLETVGGNLHSSNGPKSDEIPNGVLFYMHSLVQLATTMWLQSQTQIHHWQKSSLRIISTAISKYQAVDLVLVPHAIKVVKYVQEEEPLKHLQIHVALFMVRRLINTGRISTVLELLRVCAQVFDQDSGPDTENIRDEMYHKLGTFLASLGEKEEAEIIFEKMRKVDAQEIQTIPEAENMGKQWGQMKRYDLAETAHRWAFEKCKHDNGIQHLDTLRYANDLGDTLRHLKRFDEAEEILQTAFKGRESLLGEEHIDTLETMRILGLMLQEDGRHKEAESMLRRTRRGYLTLLGPYNSVTIASSIALGRLLEVQEKYKEAEKIFQENLDLEKARGVNEWSTLILIDRLGNLYKEQSRYKEAENMCRQVLEKTINIFGVDHVNTAVCKISLAHALFFQGHYQEAESLIQEAVGIYKQNPGSHDTHDDKWVEMMEELQSKIAEILLLSNRFQEKLNRRTDHTNDEDPAKEENPPTPEGSQEPTSDST